MNTFVMDLGFSSAKCVFGESAYRMFSAYRDGADAMVIGDEALRMTGASYLKTPEDLVKRYPAFLSACMQKAGVEKANVAVGLPYSFWVNQQELPGLGAVGSLTRGLSDLPGIGSAFVFPQGLGGIRSFLESEDVANSDRLLAIDVGFNAVIWNLFSIDEKIVHGDTYYKRGMHQMVKEHLQPKIVHYTPGYNFSPLEACVLLEKKAIQYGLDQIDISDEIEQSSNEYMLRIIDDIIGELRSVLGVTGHIDRVLLFGGGARYIAKGFNSHGKFLINVPENPEYANAYGFRLMAEDSLKNEG